MLHILPTRRPLSGLNIAASIWPPGKPGFTLLEMSVVTLLILVLVGTVSLTLANARPSVKVRRDASQCVAFLRNTWDFTKTSSSQLVLSPNWREGSLAYFDPRTQTRQTCKLSSKGHVLAIILNDRVHNAKSEAAFVEDMEMEEETSEPSGSIFLDEGRGLTELAVVFGIPEDEEADIMTYKWITMAKLNLITGHGQVIELTAEELDDLTTRAEEAAEEVEQI